MPNFITRAARHLFDLPRWLLLAALLYAPWAYGGVTTETIRGINLLAGAAVLLWAVRFVVSLWVNRSSIRPQMSPVPVAISTALLLIGWWMALNGKWIYDPEFLLFVTRSAPVPTAPGSVDYTISIAWMIRATVLLGAAGMVAELSRDEAWVWRLWWTLGLAGGSIALWGLVQKALGAPMIFWEPTNVPVTTFFSTYYYHANAGAFLNLTLWPTVGLAIRAFTRPTTAIVKALWLISALVLAIAVLANTSRMAQLAALIAALVFLGFAAPFALERVRRLEWTTALVGAVAVLIALLAVARASHLDQPVERWGSLAQALPRDARWLASQAALTAVPDAGLLGFGPGTFRVVFPSYTGYLGDRIAGVWRFLHDDYLQTLLEWGWLGASLWALLFFGGLGVGVRKWWVVRRSPQRFRSRERLLLPMMLLALACIALHALVDFPLQIASLQLYVATYLGFCWGSLRWTAGAAPTRSRSN